MHVYLAVLQPCTEGMTKNPHLVLEECAEAAPALFVPSDPANVSGPQSARLYPTQSCQRYYTPRQWSPSFSQCLWSTVSKAIPYTAMPKMLYTKTVQSVLQPPGLQSARPYPTQTSWRYYTSRQCSPSYSQCLWCTVTKAIPNTIMPKILYTKTVQSLLQPTKKKKKKKKWDSSPLSRTGSIAHFFFTDNKIPQKPIVKKKTLCHSLSPVIFSLKAKTVETHSLCVISHKLA